MLFNKFFQFMLQDNGDKQFLLVYKEIIAVLCFCRSGSFVWYSVWVPQQGSQHSQAADDRLVLQ